MLRYPILQSIVSLALLVGTSNPVIAAPVIFRNDSSQPVLMQEGMSGGCYGLDDVEASRLYLTLPADQQSSATGPWIAFRRSCSRAYPPFWCTNLSEGFTGPLEIRAQRHAMYPDCGNWSRPTSEQYVLFQGATFGPYNALDFENTGCLECQEPEKLLYPPYRRGDTTCSGCWTTPHYIGFAITINGAKHLGWMRYCFGRNPSGHWGKFPQAWAYESTPNVQITIPCDGDYNFDGAVDFFDYLNYVTDFSAGSYVSKYNWTGELSFFDYLDFLVAYTDTCP